MSTITLNGNTLSGRLGIGSYMSMGNSFSNARSSTSHLSSELGHLRNKIDAVNTSVNVDGSQATTAKTREENKSSALTCGYDKLDTLVSDVGIVDNKTATEVEKLKKDFYKKYSYLKPEKEKNWWDRVKDRASQLWDGICFIGKKIADFVGDVIDWCKDHWKELLIGLVLIVAGALITVLTGGAGTGFWAAFGMAVLKGIGVAMLSGAISGSISGGMTYITARMDGKSPQEAFSMAKKSFGDGFAQGFMMGSVGFLGGSVGSWLGGSYKAFKAIQWTAKGSDWLSKGMDGFDYGTKILGHLFPESGLLELNEKVTSNKVYSGIKTVNDYVSKFSGGAYKKAEIRDGSHLNVDGTLKKNVKYQSGENGYHYTTDSKGRITSGYADELKFKQHDGRLKHDSNTPGKLPDDDAGHIFADRFGGSNELDNLTSQSKFLNRNGKPYYNMEQDWADALSDNKSVTNVRIKIKYDGNSTRPSSYSASYKIDGHKMPKITYSN